MLVDTHAHVNFNAYKNDADEVIRRSLDNGVWMINIGSQHETSKKAVRLAEKYENGVYAAIGMHPIHVETGVFKAKMDPEEVLADNEKETVFDAEKYRELAKSSKVVAIGEIGLDYYYRPKIPTAKPSRILDEIGTKARQEIFKQKQKEIFLEQLKLAKELNLPVVFHCRSAHTDLIKILGENPGLRGMIHCFTGNWLEAEKYLKMGFYIGLNGIIFKLDLKEVIEKTPLEKILLETDCPYLTPPTAGQERNEPLFVKYIAEEVAKIKNINLEKVAEVTTQNARDLFKI